MDETPLPLPEWIKKRILFLKTALAEKRQLLIITSQEVQQLEGAINELESLRERLEPLQKK